MKKLSKIIVGALLSVASTTAFGFEKNIVETAVEAGKFKTLATALTAAGLIDAVNGPGPFTVFAPTDDAFAKVPKETLEMLLKPENKEKLKAVLTYHVVPGKVMAKDVVGLKGAKSLNGQRIDVKVDGDKVSVDGANVVATDIACTNGVIHVIDSVILPASDNIPAVATKAGKFSTLLAAAKAAGLVDALSGDKALTVFAPTDEAFGKLPKGTVESLLKPENKDKLKAILLYHVVEGRVYSEDALKAKSAATLQGGKVEITVKDGAAYVNGAKILATDDASCTVFDSDFYFATLEGCCRLGLDRIFRVNATIDYVVQKNCFELFFVLWLEQRLNGSLWQLAESFVGRSEDGQRLFTTECIDKASCFRCCEQCRELACFGCNCWNVIRCWEDNGVNDVNHTVCASDIRCDNIRAVNRYLAAIDFNIDALTVERLRALESNNVLRHDLAWYDVVCQNSFELFFVFWLEQHLKRFLRNLSKRVVGWCEYSEWTRSVDCIDQTSCGQSRSKSLELASFDSCFNDVLFKTKRSGRGNAQQSTRDNLR